MKHKWEIVWDDKENDCIDHCVNCGIKRRQSYLPCSNSAVRGPKTWEMLIDGKWVVYKGGNCENNYQK